MQTNSGSRQRSPADNRRNHYRILHVQPDAPFEVIRASYLTLMQKLKLHPDLGGDHWTAVHVNGAYAILIDPISRVAYDRELLARFDIVTLSRGPLPPGPRSSSEKRTTGSGNQRNFYRILQVQPDAPLELIEASHRALSRRGGQPAGSLTEALVTLLDPARRQAYDRTFGLGRHAAATREETSGLDGSISLRSPVVNCTGLYEPIITQYCLFCQTPQHASRSALEETGCVECASPLFPPPANLIDHVRRSLGRTPENEEIGFYTCWPGDRLSGRLLDLSPTGLRFLTAEACRPGDIIRIDAQRFQAVGVIAHQYRDRLGTMAGVKFHAVGFHLQRGSFVSARA